MYLALGAVADTFANKLDVPIVHACMTSWLLVASNVSPNCVKAHLSEPV